MGLRTERRSHHSGLKKRAHPNGRVGTAHITALDGSGAVVNDFQKQKITSTRSKCSSRRSPSSASSRNHHYHNESNEVYNYTRFENEFFGVANEFTLQENEYKFDKFQVGTEKSRGAIESRTTSYQRRRDRQNER